MQRFLFLKFELEFNKTVLNFKLMTLELIEIINSFFSLLSVTVFAIVGIIIIIRYFEYMNKNLLYMGAAWAIMGLPWLPSAVAFIVYLASSQFLPLWLYLILGYPLVPVQIILFSIVLTEAKYKEKQRLIVLFLTLFGAVFEIFFFTFLFVNPLFLAEPTLSPVDIDFGGIMIGCLVTFLILNVSMGILIGRESLKSEIPEVRLKGKFILSAFIIVLFGAGIDAILPITFIALPVVRILLILTAILFYFGFITPDWLKKRLLDKKKD